MLRLATSEVALDAAAPGEAPKRTITGIAVPYNVDATVSSGEKVRFLPGSLPEDGKAPKLIGHHDTTDIVGLVAERANTDTAMMFTAKIAATAAGNDYLELLKMGAIDSVSVGVNPTDWTMEGDTMVIKAADWHELSLVAIPAFAGATITQVAATAPEADTTPVPDDPDNNPTPTTEDTTMNQDTPAVEAAAPSVTATAPIYAQAARPLELPTAAEYIAASAAGGDRWARALAAVRAAAPDITTADTAGILPTPIVSPVYNNFVGSRPVVDAVGVKAMPGGGKVFIRPEVTTHTSMAVQSAENAALQAGTLVVSSNSVTKGVYGGYVTISEQDIDWTDPNIVALVLDDMARVYANKTDDVAADALVSGASVTRNFTDANIDSPAEWTAWLYGAASTILSSSNGNLPSHLFVSPDIWAALGVLEDTAGRPLFPAVGPMNAYGAMTPGATAGNAFGLQIVVDRNFAADTLILGEPSGFEIFEQQKGALSLTAPDTISRTISWHGYFATLMIDSAKFVKAAFV